MACESPLLYHLGASLSSFFCRLLAALAFGVVEAIGVSRWRVPAYQQSSAIASSGLRSCFCYRSESRLGNVVAVGSVKEALIEAINKLLADDSSPILTWATVDNANDYAMLESGTFFNHFENHQVLTTKKGLSSILKASAGSASFFPRCYNMDDGVERERFILDFRGCAALYVIQQHLILSGAHGPESYQGYQDRPDILHVAEEALHMWYKELLSEMGKGSGASSMHSDNGGDAQLMDSDAWKTLEQYSQLTPEEMCTNLELQSHDHAAFSPEKQRMQEQLLNSIKEVNPQAQINSSHNIWILKPQASSKGKGVGCMRSLQDILRYCIVKRNIVAQKYIETPFLLDGRKFDIRQWVLLKSASPLKAYLFSECYLRRCASAYDVTELSDRKRHLSNWAVNDDGGIDRSEDMVMSLPHFKDALAQETGRGGVWDEDIHPQLENIILTTLRAAQPHLVQRSQCFELYGFDFILDRHLKLWLLEVNSCPACDARVPFLRIMLRRMVHRMIEVACLGKDEPDGTDLDWLPLSGTES